MPGTVAVLIHPCTLLHDPGPGHPESPERLQAVLDALRPPVPGGRELLWVEAPAAEPEALERVHPCDYLDRLAAVADAGGGVLDRDTTMGAMSFTAAVHAAGAAVEASRMALDGVPAFAAIRPPGHHAGARTAMGFCLLNNVVVAARAAIEDRGVQRVLIVDWDVHHGNGTQDLVESDERIRYVSLHQWPLYPGTGRAAERGVGNIFNVPLPPGLTRARYVAALDDAIGRATRDWRPELVLISAGFDAMAGDPLAGFTLEAEDYAAWVRHLATLGAPMAAVLEGGYRPDRNAEATTALIEALP